MMERNWGPALTDQQTDPAKRLTAPEGPVEKKCVEIMPQVVNRA
jgi:hypothetical protein